MGLTNGKSSDIILVKYRHTASEVRLLKDKALEKLSKNELLELMLYLRKEYDKLNAENEKLLQKLEDKKSITDRLDRLERQVAALTGHKLVVEQPVAEEDHGGR